MSGVRRILLDVAAQAATLNGTNCYDKYWLNDSIILRAIQGSLKTSIR